MVSLNAITVKGIANIDSVTLDLKKTTALLAANNYGKSNVLSAILFGLQFIGALPQTKQRMMGFEPCISVNKYIAGKPFVFEIEGSIDGKIDFQYGYSF